MLKSACPYPAFCLLTLLVSLCASGPLHSQPHQQTASPAATRWAQKPASSDSEAAAMAVRQHGGQVLRVERHGSNYQVRLLMPDGRVKHVTVPGDAGRG